MPARDMWTTQARRLPDATDPSAQELVLHNPAGEVVDRAAQGEDFAVIKGILADQFKVVKTRGGEVVNVLHDSMPLDEGVLKTIHNSCIPDPEEPNKAKLWGRDVSLNAEQIKEVEKLLAALELDLKRYQTQEPLWAAFQKALAERRAIHGAFAESSDIIPDSNATSVTTRRGDHGTEIVVPSRVHSLYLWGIKHQELAEDIRRYRITSGKVAGDLYGTSAPNFGVTVRQLYTFHQTVNKTN